MADEPTGSVPIVDALGVAAAIGDVVARHLGPIERELREDLSQLRDDLDAVASIATSLKKAADNAKPRSGEITVPLLGAVSISVRWVIVILIGVVLTLASQFWRGQVEARFQTLEAAAAAHAAAQTGRETSALADLGDLEKRLAHAEFQLDLGQRFTLEEADRRHAIQLKAMLHRNEKTRDFSPRDEQALRALLAEIEGAATAPP